MSIYVRAKIDKTIYKNDTFRILACTPVGTYDNLVVNRYGDFIIKGDLDLLRKSRVRYVSCTRFSSNIWITIPSC